VGEVEDALRRVGPEPREDVAERQLLAVRGAMRPLLLDHGIGALLHHRHDPVARLLRAWRAGHARSERDLLARVRQRRVADERRLRARRHLVARAEHGKHEEQERVDPHERNHLVDNWSEDSHWPKWARE
jgi:hypothetical protein